MACCEFLKPAREETRIQEKRQNKKERGKGRRGFASEALPITKPQLNCCVFHSQALLVVFRSQPVPTGFPTYPAEDFSTAPGDHTNSCNSMEKCHTQHRDYLVGVHVHGTLSNKDAGPCSARITWHGS
ncbi:unnamed protein product [Victoria cruziana]